MKSAFVFGLGFLVFVCTIGVAQVPTATSIDKQLRDVRLKMDALRTEEKKLLHQLEELKKEKQHYAKVEVKGRLSMSVNKDHEGKFVQNWYLTAQGINFSIDESIERAEALYAIAKQCDGKTVLAEGQIVVQPSGMPALFGSHIPLRLSSLKPVID